jgi:hypothetical protein
VISNLDSSTVTLDDSIQPLEDICLLASSSFAGPEYFRIKVELHAILAAHKQTTTKFRAREKSARQVVRPTGAERGLAWGDDTASRDSLKTRIAQIDQAGTYQDA